MKEKKLPAEVGRLRTWIIVKRAAIKNNYRVFRSLLGPKVKLMAVVKSNAYGHGLVGFAKEVAALGVDWLGVDSITEALRLRREGIKTPILILGYTRPGNLLLAATAKVSVTISSLDSLEWLIKNIKIFSGKNKLKIHLKVDTGMHRQGFLPDNFPVALALVKKLSDVIEVEGIFSHLASSDGEKKFDQATAAQLVALKKFLAQFAAAGFDPQKVLKHSCATGRAFACPEAHFDLVRVGFGFYGLWLSPELKKRFSRRYPLQPVLTWQTIVSEIKTIPADGQIGYDFTEKVKKGTRIAILPIGYWHGFARSLSSIGEVLISGQRAKVLGRVSMDMVAVDVTKIKKTKVGAVVTLIGKKIPANEMAHRVGTSPYEIITRLNPLIKKFYL